MIQSTFQILDNVSNQKERNFWNFGIKDWNTFLSRKRIRGISQTKKGYFDRKIREARNALFNYDSSYFVDKLKSMETWRLYDFFREDTLFLDIETEGVGRNCDITVFGMYDGLECKTMIKDINLDYNYLAGYLAKFKLIVTFNGSSFDLPFIRKRYDILPYIPHIDLRHLCARLGMTGGLKEIEKSFGFFRSKIIEKFHGGDAVTLWRMYKATGDKHYLDLLVEYNEDDCFNLKKIMNYCYQKSKEMIFEKNLEVEL